MLRGLFSGWSYPQVGSPCVSGSFDFPHNKARTSGFLYAPATHRELSHRETLTVTTQSIILGLNERPVHRGDRGVTPRVLAGLGGRFLRDFGDGNATVLQCAGEQEGVVMDDLGPFAVVALGGGGDLALQGLLADV